MNQMLITALICFAIGSIPFSYWVPRLFLGIDTRKSGSGNPGATNVLRLTGKKWGALCLFLDMAKGSAGTFYALYALGEEPHTVWFPVFSVLGHIFSPFLKFRGGKGVATSAGLFLALAPLPTLGTLIIWLIVVLITSYISLGSLIAAAFFPTLVFFLQPSNPMKNNILIMGVIISIMIILRHIKNIQRLIKKEESKVIWRKR